MVKIFIGDIFQSQAKTLVNTINCVGVMGKGIALEFKSRYPDMYKDYVEKCRRKDIKPGKPYYYQDIFGTSIINFPTKDHWRSPSKLSYIVDGLTWFADNYKELGITSIAFPPLGCGNGGLSWDIVGPVMYSFLKALPIDIEIYAPYGTKKDKLSVTFLEKNLIQNYGEILGSKSVQFNPSWLLILETVKRINERKYVLAVGRTMMQKIAYILTIQGIKTDFVFKKGSYGPYCADVKNAITSFSNANLITEVPCGRMIKMQVTENYIKHDNFYTPEELKAVSKTVDLFSRIKDTAHAELLTTIIFAFNSLRLNSDSVSEQDIYDYVTNWKPHWKNNAAKNSELIDAIRDLAILQWIAPITSSGLIKSFDA